jgi:uncharacterized protein GlcG (DUF336 family)
MLRPNRLTSVLVAYAFLLSSCGGGGSSGGGSGGGGGGGGGGGSLYSVPAQVGLSVTDVKQVLAQAIFEAQAQGKPAVIAVTDRVGNVLAVYAMTGAPATTTVLPAPNGSNIDIQGVSVPAAAAAIAKAVTGAYLSSGGNAFSTRTASMIVQQHFPPGPASNGLPGGPLFGVQFSQLPCSDLASRFVSGGGNGALIGPKRSPLGLAADPGGFPLYKNGVVVGGVGIEADGVYGDDPNVLDVDNDPEENMALAGTFSFAAPASITADQIFVNGTSLRYSDATQQTLKSNPASAPAFDTLPPGTGSLTAVGGFYAGSAVLPGAIYGTEASGIRKATTAEFNNPDAFVLTDGSGNDRYTPRAGTDSSDDPAPLTASEVQSLLEQAFEIMSNTRAAIRNPLNSRAEVTMSVVDTHGAILGIVRAPDAPIFGIDVSLQKARTATFFSGKNAASDLLADSSPDVQGFVTKVRDFIPDPTALTGKFAFADRSNGDLSRPFFPDGQDGNPNGPFSRPIAQFNPFSTGLQSALVLGNLLGSDPGYCTGLPPTSSTHNRLQNGIQIFAGSVPIYKNGVLAGGIGVSGDGIDQDDMISFLGLYNAGQAIHSVEEAPTAIRADNIVITVNGDKVRLRYVNCPVAPFLNSDDQHPCDGK